LVCPNSRQSRTPAFLWPFRSISLMCVFPLNSSGEAEASSSPYGGPVEPTKRKPSECRSRPKTPSSHSQSHVAKELARWSQVAEGEEETFPSVDLPKQSTVQYCRDGGDGGSGSNS